MKTGILLFMLLFSTCLFAQKVQDKIHITTRSYYQYMWTKELSSCNDIEPIDTASVRCTWIVAYQYPYFITSDSKFTYRINKAVKSTFDYSEPSSKRLQLNSWNCPDDKPGEDLMNYKIHFNGPSFLSFTIYKDYEPSGMGNGFRHDAIPFTFDLAKKKLLRLGDIIKDHCDTIVQRIIITQLKNSYPDLFAETGEINNPGLFKPFSTLGDPFVIKLRSIILYYPLSFGGKSAYEEIEIKFSEHPELFDDYRILKFMKTKTKQLKRVK